MSPPTLIIQATNSSNSLNSVITLDDELLRNASFGSLCSTSNGDLRSKQILAKKKAALSGMFRDIPLHKPAKARASAMKKPERKSSKKSLRAFQMKRNGPMKNATFSNTSLTRLAFEDFSLTTNRISTSSKRSTIDSIMSPPVRKPSSNALREEEGGLIMPRRTPSINKLQNATFNNRTTTILPTKNNVGFSQILPPHQKNSNETNLLISSDLFTMSTSATDGCCDKTDEMFKNIAKNIAPPTLPRRQISNGFKK